MKAIIPAAGYGTRFLPVSKAIPKEMMPIGAKPAIQWIVEEAVAAGAEEVIVVTSPDKTCLRDYFTVSDEWLRRAAKRPEALAALESVAALGRRIRWAYQYEQKGLGHAVLQAAEAVRGEAEPVLVLLGDALVSGGNASAQMAALSRSRGGAGVIGLERVPRERVSRYGIVRPADAGDGAGIRLSDIVEKPAPEDAPSDLAVAGRYLLPPSVFALLADQTPGVGGEIQLTDAIRRLMTGRGAPCAQPFYGYVYPGRRHDIGNPEGYLKALEAFNGNG